MSKSQNFKNEPNKEELYVIINIEDGVKYDLRIPKHVCMVSLIHCNPFSPTYRYKRSPKPSAGMGEVTKWSTRIFSSSKTDSFSYLFTRDFNYLKVLFLIDDCNWGPKPETADGILNDLCIMSKIKL